MLSNLNLNKRLVVGVSLLCFGLMGIFFLGCDVFLAMKSEAWPKISGRLLSIELRPCKGVNRLNLNLLYEYEVGGVTFRGSNYSFTGNVCMGAGTAVSIASHLREPGRLFVAYDPTNPASATIDTGVDSIHWVYGFVGGLVATLLGAFTLFFNVDHLGHMRSRKA